MMTPLDLAGDTQSVSLPGLEPDNLLAFLTLLGLLRALEAARADWQPRISWKGPPWTAQLHLVQFVEGIAIVQAAHEGITKLVEHFDVDNRKNVDFGHDDYRRYAERMRGDLVGAALASALTAEWPQKKHGGLSAAPLVMMFGQGHQNFLERLVDVPSGRLPNRLRKLKSPPDMSEPGKIAEALFQAWRREDDADGFRWDPEEDQRYALRYDDPSLGGAAPTVIGANRLGAIGFLSFFTVPTEHQMRAVGAIREDGEWLFVWPIWRPRLARAGIEALLNHPALLQGDRGKLRLFGVAEIFRARRVANGKFMNVARARLV
jgi:hypothetical protein